MSSDDLDVSLLRTCHVRFIRTQILCQLRLWKYTMLVKFVTTLNLDYCKFSPYSQKRYGVTSFLPKMTELNDKRRKDFYRFRHLLFSSTNFWKLYSLYTRVWVPALVANVFCWLILKKKQRSLSESETGVGNFLFSWEKKCVHLILKFSESVPTTVLLTWDASKFWLVGYNSFSASFLQ